MSRFIRATVCAVFLSSACTAPVSAAEPEKVLVVTARSMDCAARYMTAMHMDETMKAMTDTMITSMRSAMPSVGSDAERAKIQKAMEVAMKETMDEIMPKAMADMEPAMLEVFDETEMCAMADFYESPTGQSIIRKMPALVQVSSNNMQKYVPIIRDRMIAAMCRLYDCAGTPLEAGRVS